MGVPWGRRQGGLKPLPKVFKVVLYGFYIVGGNMGFFPNVVGTGDENG